MLDCLYIQLDKLNHWQIIFGLTFTLSNCPFLWSWMHLILTWCFLAGTLIKVVYSSSNNNNEADDKGKKSSNDCVGIPNGSSDYPVLCGRLHFAKFETSKINECLEFILLKQLHRCGTVSLTIIATSNWATTNLWIMIMFKIILRDGCHLLLPKVYCCLSQSSLVTTSSLSNCCAIQAYFAWIWIDVVYKLN